MSRAGWFVTLACLGCFAWRLFSPPLIGIANNGDFAKIAGPLSLGPAGQPDDRFLYVTRDYKRAPQYAWQSRYRSSEAILARIAYRVSRPFQRHESFDIRWMGAVHLTLIILALAWLMTALLPLGAAAQLAAGLSAGFILGDAAYLGYCNSFYTDAAALAGLLLSVAALTDLAVRGGSRLRLAGAAAGALLLAASKTQHVLLAVPLALLIWLLVRNRAALAASLAVLAGGALFVAISPPGYRSDPLFNLIFYKLTPHSPDAARDLAVLGLGSEHLAYVGLHAYLPGAPTTNRDYMEDLVRRVSLGRVMRFYATDPRRAAAIIWRDLTVAAPIIQPGEFGNYTVESGRPPGTRASGYWTGLESRLLSRTPWLMPAWLIAAAIVCLAVPSKPAWICLGVVAMAAIELATASLLDSLDTSRHLLIFHVLLETTFSFAVTAAACAVPAVRRWLRAGRASIPA